MPSRIAATPTSREFLQMLGQSRCPCGHLVSRHRKSTGEIEGEVFGACRDCGCKGLIDWTDDEGATDE